MKKLKFRDFLLKRLLVYTAAGVAIGAAFMAVMYCFMLLTFAVHGMVTVNEAEASILNSADNRNKQRWELSLCFDYTLNKDYGLDAAGIVYDPETMEIIYTSQFNGYVIIPQKYTETGESVYLANKSEEYRNVLENSARSVNEVLIDIKEIYLDGDGFYPGRVVISKLDDSPLGEVTGEPEEYDFTPENASEYEKIDYHSFECGIGTLSDSEVLAKLLENPRTANMKGDFVYRTLENIFIDGKKYCFATLHRLDYWQYVGKGVLSACVVYIVLLIACAVADSHSKYKKYCAQYEIDEYRRNMTNALAHDLKSPLTAIYGYAENLKNNVHSEKKDYYADAVLENIQYMNEIITNTLDLAKLEITDKGLKKEKVDVAALAEELYGKYKPQAESRDISFKISGNAVVSADRKMLSQAVENLISNAVKYTTDSGEIIITADNKAFTISNSCGKNINTENLSKPFEKADSSRSNRSGSGIGLSIVKNIAMLHKFGFEAKAENGMFTAKITF